MKTMIIAITSAAFLALGGSAFAGKSTPQEREVTKQLNLEQAQQAKANNQQIASAAPAPSMAPQSAPAAAPTTPVESAPAADQAPAPAANAPAGQPAQ
ncbi:MAG TPA: hypothetical protein VNX61_10790 [Rhizomicrobium sp.]|nr:hypothetical protein [Rhizomicrobium sp.]